MNEKFDLREELANQDLAREENLNIVIGFSEGQREAWKCAHVSEPQSQPPELDPSSLLLTVPAS